MAEKSLEDRARQISQSRLQQGKEFEQLQAAQNQLLEINAAQKQNLGEQAMINNSVAAQNQLLAQAAEVGAMSVGGMRVNPATQAAMNKYGLAKPATISTSKQTQTVTKQNITINNNTTNITNVPANIGGPIQGRGIQFKDPAGEDGGMSKFRNWIQSTFTKQKEEEIKRNRDYARRETSLSKSSNKIMRKLEDFSRDITKRLDPRNISKPIADHFSTVLKLLGMGYLATHTGKILDSIQSFQENTRALWNWMSGKSKEKPEFIQKLGESVNSFLFGENTIYRPEKGVVGNIVYAFWNDDKTNPGIINRFWNKIKDELEVRADLAASAVRGNTDVGKSLKKWDFVGAVEALLDRITTYMTVFLGGKEKGLENAARKDFEKELDSHYQGKDLKRVHEKDSARRYVLGRMGGEYEEVGDTSYGALGYYEEPERRTDNFGRIASGRAISNSDRRLYGNTVSHYLNNNYISSTGKDIVDTNEAVAGQLQELLTYRELSKAGMGDGSGAAWSGINRLNRFKNRNKNSTLAINTETIDKLLNFENPGQNSAIKESMGFKETEYFAISRQKILCEYSKEHQERVLRAMVNGYATGKTLGKVATAAVGAVLLFIPGVNLVSATALSLVALAGFSGPGQALLNGAIHGLFGKGDPQAKNIGGICPKSIDGLIYTWLLYGDFDIFLLKGAGAYGEYTRNQIPPSLREYISPDGSKITITADKAKIREAQKSQEKETAYEDEEGNIVINVSKKFLDAFDKNLLQEIVRLGEMDFGKANNERVFDFRPVTEFNSSGLGTLIDSYVGGNDSIVTGLNNKNAATDPDTAKSFYDFWQKSYQSGENQPIYGGDIKKYINKIDEARKSAGSQNTNKLYSGSSSVNSSDENIKPLDMNATISSLVGHAQPNSTKLCATHVRGALEDGGLDTTNRPGDGGRYGDWLKSNGWEEVTDGNIQVGDLAVTSPFGSHIHGHIAMYSPIGNGEYKWVSDFASDNASPYSDDDGTHTKYYRYKNIINRDITSLPVVGSLGTYGKSKYRGSDAVHEDSGRGVIDYIKSAINKAWYGSIKTIKATAVDPYAPAQSWVDSVNGIPLNSSIAPHSLSSETKQTISTYFKGSNVAPSWAERAGLSGNSLKWSKLFNEEGKFLGDMTKLDPEVKTIIEGIQEATEKIATNTDEDKEIAKQQLLTAAAIGESTLAAADANSRTTATAMRTLIANKNTGPAPAALGQENNI